MIGLYIKEKMKSVLCRIVMRVMPRLQTPMQQVFLQLQHKGYWNVEDEKKALEMFGMFGVWHTVDYIDYVKEIDFFEIDRKIIGYAKKTLKKKVNFYCADSIEYVRKTEKRYDIVVADIPYSFNDGFDEKTGIPPFMKDMVHAVSSEWGGGNHHESSYRIFAYAP